MHIQTHTHTHTHFQNFKILSHNKWTRTSQYQTTHSTSTRWGVQNNKL